MQSEISRQNKSVIRNTFKLSTRLQSSFTEVCRVSRSLLQLSLGTAEQNDSSKARPDGKASLLCEFLTEKKEARKVRNMP